MTDESEREWVDYSDLFPDSGTPDWDEYRVTIDGVEVPTYQIDVVDDRLAVSVDPSGITAEWGFVYLEPRECFVESPLESFIGTITGIQIEEGQVALYVSRCS